MHACMCIYILINYVYIISNKRYRIRLIQYFELLSSHANILWRTHYRGTLLLVVYFRLLFTFVFSAACFCRGQIDLEIIHLHRIRVFRTLSHICNFFFKYLLPRWIYNTSHFASRSNRSGSLHL